MAKAPTAGTKGSMACRSDYVMSAGMQPNLWMPQGSQMDSAEIWTNSESKGCSSSYAEAGSVGSDPAKKEIYLISAGNSQVSQSASEDI